MDIRLNDYRPYGDGVNNDAEFINKAILDCHNGGGGFVHVTGVHKCGTIEILDNVHLVVEKDAKIILSDNLDDFYDIKDDRDTQINRPTWEYCEYNGKPSKYFIYAKGKSNCGIVGDGIINGNQEIFYGAITKWHIEGAFYPRIPLIYFEDCQEVTIKDITLEKSAFWTVHLVGCSEVLIESISINNDLRMVNSDGIDPDHCHNVIINNCKISCADDCIVFKATDAFKEYGPCENIKVFNCELTSTSAAIKFGTETTSDINGIYISDCKILNSNRGISFMLRDEGNIHTIGFNNIHIETRRFSPLHWWGKAEPVAVTAVRRNENTKIGKISNITFYNMTGVCENGVLIYGEDECNIDNLLFDNFKLKLVNKTKWEKNIGIDLRPSVYNIIDGKIAILNCFNSKNIVFNDFKYNIDKNILEYIENEINVCNSDVEINMVKI